VPDILNDLRAELDSAFARAEDASDVQRSWRRWTGRSRHSVPRRASGPDVVVRVDELPSARRRRAGSSGARRRLRGLMILASVTAAALAFIVFVSPVPNREAIPADERAVPASTPAESRIVQIDPRTGKIISAIPPFERIPEAKQSPSAADPDPAPAQAAPGALLVDRANQAVGSLLARGTPLTAEERAALKTSPGVAEYKGDLDRARSFTPPQGAAAKEPWLIIPAGDGSGGACIEAGNGLACGGPDLVASAGVAVAKVSRPADSVSLYAPGGRLHMSGFVPDNITSIVVFNHDRKLVEQVDVVEQLYELDIATGDFGSIEYRDSTGRAVKTIGA
jgi:hypothetical protein